jgi:hypothetical protein
VGETLTISGSIASTFKILSDSLFPSAHAGSAVVGSMSVWDITDPTNPVKIGSSVSVYSESKYTLKLKSTEVLGKLLRLSYESSTGLKSRDLIIEVKSSKGVAASIMTELTSVEAKILQGQLREEHQDFKDKEELKNRFNELSSDKSEIIADLELLGLEKKASLMKIILHKSKGDEIRELIIKRRIAKKNNDSRLVEDLKEQIRDALNEELEKEKQEEEVKNALAEAAEAEKKALAEAAEAAKKAAAEAAAAAAKKAAEEVAAKAAAAKAAAEKAIADAKAASAKAAADKAAAEKAAAEKAAADKAAAKAAADKAAADKVAAAKAAADAKAAVDKAAADKVAADKAAADAKAAADKAAADKIAADKAAADAKAAAAQAESDAKVADDTKAAAELEEALAQQRDEEARKAEKEAKQQEKSPEEKLAEEEQNKKFEELLTSIEFKLFDAIDVSKVTEVEDIMKAQRNIFAVYSALKLKLPKDNEFHSRIVDEINSRMLAKLSELFLGINRKVAEDIKEDGKPLSLEEEERIKKANERRFDPEPISSINLDEFKNIAEAQSLIIERFFKIKNNLENGLKEESISTTDYEIQLSLLNSMVQDEFNSLYLVQLKSLKLTSDDDDLDLNFIKSVSATLITHPDIYKALVSSAIEFSILELSNRLEGSEISEEEKLSQFRFLQEDLRKAKDIEFTFFNADTEAYQKELSVEGVGLEIVILE